MMIKNKIKQEMERKRKMVLALSQDDFMEEVAEWLEDLYYAANSSAHQFDHNEKARIAACIERINGKILTDN